MRISGLIFIYLDPPRLSWGEREIKKKIEKINRKRFIVNNMNRVNSLIHALTNAYIKHNISIRHNEFIFFFYLDFYTQTHREKNNSF